MSSTDSIFGVDFKAVPITTSIAKKLKLNIGNYDDKMIRLSFEDISEDKSKIFTISILIHTDKHTKQKIELSGESGRPEEYFFIGLALINIRNQDESSGVSYLERSITHDLNSCLPFYFLLDNNLLRKSDVGSTDLKHAIYFDDVFPDFYCQVYNKDSNPIRKRAIAKLAYEKFPEYKRIILNHARQLFLQNEFEECIKVLAPAQKRSSWGTYDWTDDSQAFELLYFSYVKSCDEKGVEHLLESTELLREPERSFFVANITMKLKKIIQKQ